MFLSLLKEALTEALADSLKLLPFLFLTYLAMEYIEHKAGQKAEAAIRKSGKWGPVAGALLGIVPQCGFSAAAANLYAGRIITLGTLFAVFLSTSDEMLPILISEQAPFSAVAWILLTKLLIGMAAGFLVDLLWRRREREEAHLQIGHMCDHEKCHCGEGRILSSAVHHTLQIFFFIGAISFGLNALIGFVGEEKLSAFLAGSRVLGPLLAGVIGLIPNCASSVVITQLYLEGLLSAGSMLSGLLAGSGVGLLVLFRVNDNIRENLKITGLLYAIGAAAGILIDIL